MTRRRLRGCFKAALVAGSATLVAAVLAVGGAVPALGAPAAAHHGTHTQAPVHRNTHAAPAVMVAVPAGTTVVHGKRVTWSHICTNAEQSLCETANGAGNTNTVVPSGYNKWQAISVGGSDIEWQNGSGNCMKASTPGDFVTVINGPCDGGVNKRWTVGGQGNVTFYSAYAGGYMGVGGHPFNGSHVVIGQAQSGFYYGWVTPTCCTRTVAKTTAVVRAVAAQRRCTRDIGVRRYTGEAIASWSSKCIATVQVFAQWNDGVTRYGAKSSGLASVVHEPTSLPLAKPWCAGDAGYNAAGQQVWRKVTFPAGGNC